MASERKVTRAKKQVAGDVRKIKPKFEEERKSIAPIQAKNDFQRKVLKALNNAQIVVLLAPAGVGKSLLTMGTASDWYVKGFVNKILITRPAVGMGKTLGLLKGDLASKFTPYLMPLIEVFIDRHGRGKYDTALNSGDLEMIPLEYIRGRNINDVCIMDEAQNSTKEEMFSIITRVTEKGRLFIIGDPTQNDLKQESGLVWLMDFVAKHNLQEHIEVITATSDDIVRGGMCKSFVKAMERESGSKTSAFANLPTIYGDVWNIDQEQDTL